MIGLNRIMSIILFKFRHRERAMKAAPILNWHKLPHTHSVDRDAATGTLVQFVLLTIITILKCYSYNEKEAWLPDHNSGSRITRR